MPVTLNARPEHGFDQPLGLLSDCHRRIEHFLGVLLTVAGRDVAAPLGAAERDALTAALRYFREAAPRHTKDEEESLFPRLRVAADAGDARAAAALAAVERLEADHAAADLAHAEVDCLGRRWLEQGGLSPDELSRVRTLLADLRERYREHIAVEDREVFPMAAGVLPEREVQQIGQEMAARRGIAFPPK